MRAETKGKILLILILVMVLAGVRLVFIRENCEQALCACSRPDIGFCLWLVFIQVLLVVLIALVVLLSI